MTAYLVAFGVGLVLAVASRVAIWGDLRRARRTRTEPRIGLVAPALFIFTISGALVLVGAVGMQSQADSGHHPPVPLDLMWTVVAVCVVAMVVLQQRRRRRLSKVRDAARRRVHEADSGQPPSTK